MIPNSDGATSQASDLQRRWVPIWEPIWEPIALDGCGRVWTPVDACGRGSLLFRAVWTAVDGCGHCLEIYGSGGWGFEFLRACHRNPCESRGFVASGVSAPGRSEALGAILGSIRTFDRRFGWSIEASPCGRGSVVTAVAWGYSPAVPGTERQTFRRSVNSRATHPPTTTSPSTPCQSCAIPPQE